MGCPLSAHYKFINTIGPKSKFPYQLASRKTFRTSCLPFPPWTPTLLHLLSPPKIPTLRLLAPQVGSTDSYLNPSCRGFKENAKDLTASLSQDSWCPLLVHSIPPGSAPHSLDTEDTDEVREKQSWQQEGRQDQEGKKRRKQMQKTQG